MVIAHELLGGGRRYGELQERLPGIGSSVLADRLRQLEHAGVVVRRPGDRGAVVVYEFTDAGRELEPAMRALRTWGVRYLYDSMATHATPDGEERFDVSFVKGYEDLPAEEYEWQIDGDAVALVYENGALFQHPGPARRPAVVSSTTGEFMERWAAGSSSWDEGRDAGEVHIKGSEAAWRRMLAATGYLRAYPSGTNKALPEDR